MDPNELNETLALATRLARDAGQIQRDRYETNFEIRTKSAEIDLVTVQRANHIVCDSIEACQKEAGDFRGPIQDGITDWRLMRELSGVVTGRQTGRAVPEDVTLFKSVGLAIEDVAMAAKIIDLAQENGLGENLPF